MGLWLIDWRGGPMPCFCWTYLNDDTIRTWHRLYREEGIEGLAGFGHEGSACRLSGVQQDKLTACRDAARDNSRGWCLDRDRMRHHL
jgi:hypothetical protein